MKKKKEKERTNIRNWKEKTGKKEILIILKRKCGDYLTIQRACKKKCKKKNY